MSTNVLTLELMIMTMLIEIMIMISMMMTMMMLVKPRCEGNGWSVHPSESVGGVPPLYLPR